MRNDNSNRYGCISVEGARTCAPDCVSGILRARVARAHALLGRQRRRRGNGEVLRSVISGTPRAYHLGVGSVSAGFAIREVLWLADELVQSILQLAERFVSPAA